MKRVLPLLAALACTLTLTSCGVSQTDYDAMAAERDALQAQVDDLSSQLEDQDQEVTATLTGSFVATIRMLIPNYTLDDTTPRCAVVTLFQDSPFIIPLNEHLIDGLEIGRSYVFTIQDQEVTVPYQEWLEDPVSPEVALALYPLSYDSIRPAEEGGGGINFDHTLHLI